MKYFVTCLFALNTIAALSQTKQTNIADTNKTSTNYTISGKIVTPNNIPIQKVIVKLNNTDSVLTATDGSYSFSVPAGGNYTITPSKNNDVVKANGVDIIDALLVQRHILNNPNLGSPYQLIAADIDGNNLVNSTDLIRIKRLILGIDTTFKNTSTNENRLWAFVDSSYVFPIPTNPSGYSNSITINNIAADQVNKTFIGVKLGDVNLNVNTSLGRIQTTIENIPFNNGSNYSLQKISKTLLVLLLNP